MNYKYISLKNGKIYNNINFKYDYNYEYEDIKHFKNWPVVYIIYNKNKRIAYVGETVDLKTRLIQHYQDDNKREFRDANTKVIFIDYDFSNKSVCLDLESFLIYNMQNDQRFILFNGNAGLQKYEYYNKNVIETFCIEVWEELYKNKIVNNKYKQLNNSYKYSPYISLNQEQKYVVKQIIKELCINNKKLVFIDGGAGTGKTAIAIHLLKLLIDYSNNENKTILEDMVDEKLEDIIKIFNYFFNSSKKIGIIIPMSNLFNIIRKSISKIIIDIDNYIFQPMDAVKKFYETGKQFDILIVDEAHSLTKPQVHDYSENQIQILKKLCMEDKNQLEWITSISKKQVLFYDGKQRTRKWNIEPEEFEKLQSDLLSIKLELTVQERCLYAGKEYIDFLRTIFNSETTFNDDTISKLKESVTRINTGKGNNRYKFLMYDDVTRMTDDIKRLFDDDKSKVRGKCYNLSGMCWENKNAKNRNEIYKKYKPKDIKDDELKYNEFFDEILKKEAYSIEIENNYKNIWNYPSTNWLNSLLPSRNQIGCIHEVGGLDAEYIGVIIGPDLELDNNNKLKGVRKKYIDIGKNGASEEETLEYILDSYYILCSRARRGTFIYIYDPKLRDVFKKFMKIVD